MKVIYLTQLAKLEIGESEKPEIVNPKDILVKMKSVGVCGSDIHYFQHGRIGDQIVQFPYVEGHEGSGVVEAVGPEVRKFKAGDRVVIDPAIFCGHCNQCKAGRFHTCFNLKFLGTPASETHAGLDGCLREYIVMPEASLFHLPEQFDFEDGALFEPLTIGYYAVELGQLKAGQTIAILGTGPIGLSVMSAAQYKNPQAIYTTELLPYRLELAHKMGAKASFNSNEVDSVKEIIKQEPEGVDVVFECAGQQETIDQAIKLLKPGGILVLVGIPQENRISIDLNFARRKEIRIQNVRRQNDCTQLTIDAVVKHQTNLSPFKTHRFIPEQAQEAFELVQNYRDGVVKAFINWE